MKRSFIKIITLALLISGTLAGCTIIRPGQVALKQRLGKLRDQPLAAGPHVFDPFITRILKINVRTVEIFETLPLPTREGLSVDAQIILLYHVKPESAREVYINYGTNYENVFVQSNFLATSREVSARYYAKELYAIEREKVEKVIADELRAHIGDKGFSVDAVLLKDIILPDAMSQAIQNKVNAEQAALQMDFVIDKQRKEAERVYIEAQGIKRAQNTIDSSLTTTILQYNQIQALKGLMVSPNAKVIISDGKLPVIIGEQ
ncbi:MAG: prohibitin family protein [Bacteroidia bacterium]|nr:prohibitin family protein [Bacteroidia bacterium]